MADIVSHNAFLCNLNHLQAFAIDNRVNIVMLPFNSRRRRIGRIRPTTNEMRRSMAEQLIRRHIAAANSSYFNLDLKLSKKFSFLESEVNEFQTSDKYTIGSWTEKIRMRTIDADE